VTRARLATAALLALGLAALAIPWLPAAALAEVEEVEHFDTLEALTTDADVVVLGRVVAAAPGRASSGCGDTAATLAVERVLAGRLLAPERRVVVAYSGFCGPLPRLGVEIPVERAVFFLRNEATALRRFGGGGTDAELAEASRFYRLAILAGTVVERQGAAHVPEPLNADFLVAFEGSPFVDFVERVRSIGGGETPQPSTPSPPSAAAPDPLVVGALAISALAAVALVVAAIAVGRRGRRPTDPTA
jgi:hypothetical protein